ncbi:Histone H1.4 [Trichinella pseudospiralis]|uniref:Histone H1.4 n=2 Tax=Trichinella pseudospiralis TaxID=6337 RepID=A0A0V1EIS7_TRIPS|nr:Histone H1.4 [Trichinella pseudospiralis]KRY73703.1 Histone H1.4 [Trichinella pseudospiralis]KRY89063.1 Histone H1.4 [Trichinella pseudospiralis]KRZ19865.1 Histone H1.4 [Trichinella pseudospiralis]KRZ44980.1 Histone H1.4 [Trichinella pseudospiralis]
MSSPNVAASATSNPAAAPNAQKKSRAPKKPKTASNHPAYTEMIVTALKTLKDHHGSSRQGLLKYIMANYNVGTDAKMVNAHMKMALKRGLKSGTIKLAKGTGASGRFRVGETKPAVMKKPKKATNTVKKTTVKKSTKKQSTGGASSSSTKVKVKKPRKPKSASTTTAAAASKKTKAAKPKKVKAGSATATSKKPKASKPKAAKPKKPSTPKTKKATPKKA